MRCRVVVVFHDQVKPQQATDDETTHDARSQKVGTGTSAIVAVAESATTREASVEAGADVDERPDC